MGVLATSTWRMKRSTTLKHLFADKDGKISWDEFKKAHFSSDGRDEDNAEQMKEDEQRFKQADIDGDGNLDLKEYTSFYHPGVSPEY